MKIDLHIHSNCSDGNLSIEEIFEEAEKRNIDLISITDHDSIEGQEKAVVLAREYHIKYITGVELNVTFQYNDGNINDNSPQRIPNKSVSLDFLGYQFDIRNKEISGKLKLIREHRENRARQILKKLNIEFDKERIERFTEEDIRKIENSVDGTFGRPHIADYMINKGIVSDRQEAFDRYLVKCDVPKYPLLLAEASRLIRNAGGMLVMAHPNDPNGTSLISITRDLDEQAGIIEKYMLKYIDGIECWHSRHDTKTTAHYIDFARKHSLLTTGGSDCHQSPIIMGTLDIPDCVAEQFQ